MEIESEQLPITTSPIRNMTETKASDAAESKRRPWLTLLVIVLGLLAAAPWILAKTTLRDRLLNAIVGSDDITLMSTNASFGYFTPLSLSGLQIRSPDDSTRIEVERIQADKSWLSLLLSRPELGTFRFLNPRVDLLVDPVKQKGEAEKSAAASQSTGPVQLPNLTVEIQDAAIAVRTPTSPKPPIDLKHVGLTLRISQEANGPVLHVDPTTVFDHQPLTPELCGQGLQLIAPLLADEVAAKGEFSLRLDHFQLPIGRGSGADPQRDQQDMHIEGELQLHQASVGLRNTIAKRISDVILQLIGAGDNDRLTVTKDLVVSFQVLNGRVHHQGLALILPRGDSSIHFTSSGSVGLDETLDLQVAVKLPDELLGGGALVQKFTKDAIVLGITGTLDEPKVNIESNSGLVGSIQSLIKGTGGEEQDDRVMDEAAQQEAVTDVIDGAVDVASDILGNLRQRMEQQKEAAEQAPAEEAEPRPGLRGRIFDRPLLRNRNRTQDEPAVPSAQPPSAQPPSAQPPSALAPVPEPPVPKPPTPQPPQPNPSGESPQPIDL